MEKQDWRLKNRGRKQERHGLRHRPEYQIWLQMKGRCTNPRNRGFKWYGARGITVCARWMNSFAAFFADMGPRPEGLTLERRENDGPYSPENCLWASMEAQRRNKRNNLRIAFRGERLILADWETKLGLAKGVLYSRLYVYGWSVKRALTTPSGADKTTSRFITYNGRTQTMVKWAKELGIRYSRLKSRIANGWPVKDALECPPQEKTRKRGARTR